MNARAYLFMLACFCVCLSCRHESQKSIPEVDLSETFEQPKDFINKAYADVATNPRSSAAWGRYAMALHAHEFLKAARTCYLQAIALDPQNAKWHYLLAQLVQAQSPSEALKHYQMGQSFADRAELFRLRQAELLETTGSNVQARELYQAIQKSGKYYDLVTYRLARLHFAQGEIETSQSLLNSLSAEALLTGEVQQLSRQLQAALNQTIPDHVEIAQEQALLASDPFMAELQSLRKDPFSLSTKYLQRIRQGDHFWIKPLEQLSVEYPELDDVQLAFLQSLVLAGSYDQAQQRAEAALSESPESINHLRVLASVLILQQDWDQAQITLQQILRLNDQDLAAQKDLEYVRHQLTQP